MGCKQFRYYLNAMLFLGLIAQGVVVSAASIVGSKHDLSTSGGGVDEICVFCHTPHDANADLDNDGAIDIDHATRPPAPLWNRRISDMSKYSMYTSDTLNANCDDTPSPLSLVCLSCHDIGGAITGGLGGAGESGAVTPTDMHNAVNEPNRKNLFQCAKSCHQVDYTLPEWWQIGPDLTNEHPISITYPVAGQAGYDPDFFIPPDQQKGWSDVKLFMGRVECPSCHNPHDPANVPFLRKSMAGSGLCTTCHNK